MRDYGSRFCLGCGKLFDLAEPGERRCGSCASGEPPPPAPVKVAVKPPPKPRQRKRAPVARPKMPAARAKRAVEVNGATVPGQRTLPMLRALAGAPKGLTTPDLAELIAPSASSWINALGSVRVLMLKQEKRGRVRQAGEVPGIGTRPSILWQITGEGRRYVRDAEDSQPKAAKAEPVAVSAPATKPEPDLDEPLRSLLPPNAAGNMARWVLESHGFHTLGDLLYVTGAEMLAWWQFGPGCLEAVREGLASRGLVLVDELDPEGVEDDGPPGAKEEPTPAAKSPRDHRAERIAEAKAGKRKINHCTEQAYNYDGCRCDECKFAHSFALALKRAKRKLRDGQPLWALSAAERDRVENELAYREGRQWYRGTPDGHVIEAVIPRWVADGWFTPRRTVLEQLEDAMRYEP